MDFRTKALLCLFPFMLAAYLGFSLAAPAVQTSQEKQQAVDDKNHELEELKGKLGAKVKVQKEKLALEGDLLRLRESVPKTPELELLNIDLEKMCLDSGMDIIVFKQAEDEDLKKLGESKGAPASEDNFAGRSKGLKDKVKNAMAPVTGPKAGKKGKGKGKDEEGPGGEADAGLSKVTMLVKAIGDYPGLMELMNKIETYQRVVAVDYLESSVPKKEVDKGNELPDDKPPSEGETQGNCKRLNITMLLTAYYLP